MDMRVLPCYKAADIIAEAVQIAKGIEAKYGVKVEFEPERESIPQSTSKDAPVIAGLAKAIKKVYGIDTRCVGIGGGTVGAYLRGAGIDCAVWSRMDDTAHQPNEYAYIDNIIGDSKVMRELMLS
jgi:succinyl-diaminopimelate desuccinylase